MYDCIHENVLNEIDAKYKIVKRLEGGMSNFTYLIEDDVHNKYIYRYPDERNNKFVSYIHLNDKLVKLSQLNITNELVYYNKESGVKICKYIEGVTPKAEIDFKGVANTLKKLHMSNLKFENYKHLERLNEYEQLANNRNEDYFIFKYSWVQIFKKFLKENIVYPTHGDSQLSNIVIGEGNKVYLIDWEFSGCNDYIYDIASFGNQNFEFALNLLYSYESEVDLNKLRRLYGWRIFQCLQWYNVALYKYNIGLSEKLNIDFLNISSKYILEVEELLGKYNNLKQK